MLEFVLSTLGILLIAGYVYVGARVGRASVKNGASLQRAAWEAFIWPDTLIAKALEKLVK